MKYHDFFLKRIVPGEKILDIGCGNGALAYSVANYGGIVTGIDISEKNIILAQKLHSHPNIQYLCGNALTYTNMIKYDAIILSNVLEHIQNRTDFLKRILSLYPNARFLIRVPRKDRHWSVYFKEELGLNWMLDDTHYTEYTYNTFEKELNDSGLSIIYCEFQWDEIWAEAVHKT